MKQIKYFLSSLLVVLFSVLSITNTTQAKSVYHGTASYYGYKFHGRLTASGARYNQWAMTAAHKNLPFGTKVRVTNLANKRSVVLKITDRGPYVRGRIIDISRGANAKIDCHLCKVKVEVISLGDGKYRRER